MVLTNIQSLRAVAAIAVVFFHLPTFGFVSPIPDPLQGNLVQLGASGVDIFFVISGFIMSLSYDQRPVSARVFLVNRAVRIVPLYWCVTMFWWLWLVATSDPFGATTEGIGHLAASLMFLAQPAGYALPFIETGWTLEYEALFYLIFACAAGMAHSRALTVCALVVVAAVFGGHFIILEFALGMWAYQIYKGGVPARTARLMFGLGVAVLLMTAVVGFNLSFENSLTSKDRLLAWGLPAFLIVLGAASMPPVSIRGLALLGDASYSIYLTHAVTIIALSNLIAVTFVNPLLAQAVCFALCIGGGIAVYTWIERPLMPARKTGSRHPLPRNEAVTENTNAFQGPRPQIPPQ